ncbi:MAG: UDP-glucose/GDP-mannose dehydrogenase family protein [Thermoleophilia bacterium]|nr:UDP-glucose/GDP-mannose dehydrogenase family protein [Thermoleophilia bacterium]
MKVAVFGLGYVGTVTAVALARDGHEVIGIDPAAPKVDSIRAGRPPVTEPGLDQLTRRVVSEGRLRATGDAAEALAGAELSLVCVGTPSLEDGSLDLGAVRQVAAEIGAHLHAAAVAHLVVIRSTVLPGSTREQVIPAVEHASGRPVGEGWDVAVNPEFLREGSSLADYDAPSRILVGERQPGTGSRALALYERIVADRVVVPLEAAEAVKYTDNAFHALKIAFTNEVARVWAAHGADPGLVMEIVAADRKLNASPAYLRPGFAFGGSCLPKDLRALTAAAREACVPTPLLDAVLPSNELEVQRAVEAVLATGKRRVALLGLAFKAGTDDLRESPLLALAGRLAAEGLELRIHDPVVRLSALQGANRAYLEARLPEVSRLLCERLDEALDGAEIVVIGHGAPRYARDDEWRGQGKVVMRLE